MQVIPTVFDNSFFKAEEKIQAIKELTHWVQIDVSDGFFTPGKSFELELVGKIELIKTLLWDVHLMLKEPIKWLEKCLFVGASRVAGQVESMSDPETFVKNAKDMGMEVGLAYDIDTPVGKIPEETDFILLMGRKAGFEQTDFERKVLEKIKGIKIPVAIDGGVNLDNIDMIEKAGASWVYAGRSFIDLINRNG